MMMCDCEGLIDGEVCPRKGECRGDPSGSIEVMSGKEPSRTITSAGHGRVAPTPWLQRLIGDEACAREGDVGTTRQGQQRLWSGIESLRTVTSARHGRVRPYGVVTKANE